MALTSLSSLLRSARLLPSSLTGIARERLSTGMNMVRASKRSRLEASLISTPPYR